LLDHLGYVEQANRINDAVAADLAERGTATRTTAEIGADLVARLN